ncbi:DNA-binding protein [Aureimonas altamirensis]|uniref:DNA-binding protein n=1 Tax=Aureimonas altamirensis TaxID=370622 RepID=UPI0020373A37|nr:DNA-binding protein [Aureimonas altamirensis]MCM2505837.1 DNA-binding protein [Aureimonas altamirensis]
MVGRIVQFSSLSGSDRQSVSGLPRFGQSDRVFLRVRHSDGAEESVNLPPAVAQAVEILLDRMSAGERVAVLTEEQEVSPSEAASILGISRPLVVLRMDRGELPFRYVGKHRRAILRDVLRLKSELDKRRGALDDLSADTEELIVDHNL